MSSSYQSPVQYNICIFHVQTIVTIVKEEQIQDCIASFYVSFHDQIYVSCSVLYKKTHDNRHRAI